MKKIIIITIIALNNLASANTFKVNDPTEYTVRKRIPIEYFTCKRLPFGAAQLQLNMPTNVIGDPYQKGVLLSNNLSSTNECIDIINKLKISEHNNPFIEINFKVIERTILRLRTLNELECEGAKQEIATTLIEGLPIYQSNYLSEGYVACPKGIYSYHIDSLDQAIYVLHENGIPSSPDL